MSIANLRAFLLIGATIAWPSVGGAQDASTLPFQKSDQRPANAGPLKPGANSFAESQAKQLLEAQGYSDISTLMNDSEGFWRGTARKDNREVDVSVDFQGHVAAK